MVAAQPRGNGARGGNGIQGSVEKPDSTRRPATPQCPRSPVDLAHAERETLRRVIVATAAHHTSELVADLQSLWRSAEKRLRDARRAQREAGRTR